MRSDSLLIELDGEAAASLRTLMTRFGERRADDMISTALSVMDALSYFVHDGLVTVVDPKAEGEIAEAREVDLLFEKLRNRTAESSPTI